jgi:hypothetical protein
MARSAAAKICFLLSRQTKVNVSYSLFFFFF